jgi:hypothetical protein
MTQQLDFLELGRSFSSSHDRSEVLVFRSAEDWSRHQALVHPTDPESPDTAWRSKSFQ